MDRCALHRVYRLVFPNGKSYVGQTRRLPHERFREHGTGKSLVRRAIDKYGANNVKLRTLVIVPHDEVDIAERVFIAAYDALAPGGYNIAGGGRGVMVAPSREEYTRVRCAFWSARVATAYDSWKIDCEVPDELAPYVYEYAKRTSSKSTPPGYFDRSIFEF